VVKKKGKAKATVSASVKLSKTVYWVMKEKRPYHSGVAAAKIMRASLGEITIGNYGGLHG